ncbi:aminotransferase class I/II-fold pyridoxal phosphate-dependent enzyme [Massilia endophytica]|uniref:aminotransferase class I/II-fold pyridoxal phosphate-dependent enzyme n=1 Tax=Massilia endophytica TaxID=2899220 RepID=UPI001E64D239|nr:aminotransferase class I/II-fold pyridoxal phosphate-dependent enzyme [Massilia endophytica]UGQ48441.1 aminotransferase class I/II-fold pyridoxal phosphate-dependent enzyme [Massilia endophytica]
MGADFTSALYLGMRHPVAALRPWSALTLGKPAALEPAPGEAALGAELAALMDCEAACLMPSTLHLFWDLFGWLRAKPVAVLVDAAAYPVARWGAAAAGVAVQAFRHGDAARALGAARRWRNAGLRPLLLADGYTPGDGAAPPLAAYAEIAESVGGLLLLDDTQALGVLGPRGGGSVAGHGLAGAPVLSGASLAKGFGAPLAVLAGPREALAGFEAASQCRLHCSPPSVAAIAAAAHALECNRRTGDMLRQRLQHRIVQLRALFKTRGLKLHGGSFPVQRLALAPSSGAALHSRLSQAGIEVLLQGTRAKPVLTMLLRADHGAAEIAHAARTITQLLEVQHV